jgi:hypothetical protein
MRGKEPFFIQFFPALRKPGYVTNRRILRTADPRGDGKKRGNNLSMPALDTLSTHALDFCHFGRRRRGGFHRSPNAEKSRGPGHRSHSSGAKDEAAVRSGKMSQGFAEDRDVEFP